MLTAAELLNSRYAGEPGNLGKKVDRHGGASGGLARCLTSNFAK
jgi:hypothetical protein